MVIEHTKNGFGCAIQVFWVNGPFELPQKGKTSEKQYRRNIVENIDVRVQLLNQYVIQAGRKQKKQPNIYLSEVVT